MPVAAFEMDLARFDQRLAHLFDEEGVAFRLSEDPVQELGGDILLEDGEQQISGFLPSEAAQLEPRRQPIPIEIEQRFVQWPGLVPSSTSR